MDTETVYLVLDSDWSEFSTAALTVKDMINNKEKLIIVQMVTFYVKRCLFNLFMERIFVSMSELCHNERFPSQESLKDFTRSLHFSFFGIMKLMKEVTLVKERSFIAANVSENRK